MNGDRWDRFRSDDRPAWRRIRLKHTVERPVTGDWGSEPRGDASDTLCVRVADFDYGHGRLKAMISTVRSLDPARRQPRELHCGDLLIEKSGGGDKQPVGRVVLVDRDPDTPTVCSNFIARLRPRPGFDPRYLSYLHRGIYSSGRIKLAIKQTTGIQNLDLEHYLAATVSIPSLDEQRRTADFLDDEVGRLDSLAQCTRRLLVLLNAKRAAVARAAVSGELSDGGKPRGQSGLTWLPTLPSHWRVAKLSLVARLGTGHTPSRSEGRYWETERDIPWLTTSDIERFRDDRFEVLTETTESISELGLENSSAVLHPAGTVALSRTASIGFSVIMGRDMATSQDFVTWTCSSLVEPRFLLFCLRAMREDLLGRLAMGSTHQTIYMPDVQGLRIPLPQIDQQRRAVDLAQEKMHKIDDLSALVRRQLPLLNERRKALITEAVTGQLDPTSYRASALTA
jgi:type I restriction enzyme S subunit